MTTKGEILAAFVTEEIPRGLSPQETIKRLRDQGAFISVSHPFDSWRNGAWKLEDLVGNCPAGGCNRDIQCPLHQPRWITKRRLDLPSSITCPARLARMPTQPLSWEKPGWCCQQFTGPDELRKVIREGKVQGGLSSVLGAFCLVLCPLAKNGCIICRRWGGGGIGRRCGLKIRRWRHRVGSTPTRPTGSYLAGFPANFAIYRHVSIGCH